MKSCVQILTQYATAMKVPLEDPRRVWGSAGHHRSSRNVRNIPRGFRLEGAKGRAKEVLTTARESRIPLFFSAVTIL